MHHSLSGLADWHKALTLSERAAALRRAGLPSTGDDDLAGRRLARWRGQEPFAGDGLFARRLALDGLTEDELHALLGEPAGAVAARQAAPLPWVTPLAEAFARPAPESFPEPALALESPSAGFLNALSGRFSMRPTPGCWRGSATSRRDVPALPSAPPRPALFSPRASLRLSFSR